MNKDIKKLSLLYENVITNYIKALLQENSKFKEFEFIDIKQNISVFNYTLFFADYYLMGFLAKKGVISISTPPYYQGYIYNKIKNVTGNSPNNTDFFKVKTASKYPHGIIKILRIPNKKIADLIRFKFNSNKLRNIYDGQFDGYIDDIQYIYNLLKMGFQLGSNKHNIELISNNIYNDETYLDPENAPQGEFNKNDLETTFGVEFDMPQTESTIPITKKIIGEFLKNAFLDGVNDVDFSTKYFNKRNLNYNE